MKVLVTGGTGFVGKRLVNKLIEAGDKVVVTAREPDGLSDKVTFVKSDVRNKKELENAFRDVDVVYHLAICLDESSPDLWDINVDGTKNVVELCKKFKVKQLVYVSSSGVLGETKTPSKENLPYNPKTVYEKSKMESEIIIKNSGINYTILRTTIVIGPNLIWAAIFEAARKQHPIIGSGKNYFHLVYVDDIVNALLIVKNSKKSYGQIFHIASEDTPTYEDVYRIISNELNVEMTKKHVPLWIAILGSRFYELKCKLNGKKPKVTKMRSSIDRLIRNRIISIEKAKNVLGFQPVYDTRTAVKETIKYLKISRLGYSDYDIADISRIKEYRQLKSD
ncbi:NAD(P)-dependent oxidoreductase [archaeon]|nr:NAD(P)-dependent oxidoreductase [archaeon]